MQSQPLVLIVDDDLDSRTRLEIVLRASGFPVMTAVNGKDALGAARRRRPHVILLDLAMPVMDGFEFRAEQLRDERLAPIPVICVSGRHDAQEAARALNVAGCLAKPFDLDAVVTQVRALCDCAQV